jgi:hypothetical protein
VVRIKAIAGMMVVDVLLMGGDGDGAALCGMPLTCFAGRRCCAVKD